MAGARLRYVRKKAKHYPKKGCDCVWCRRYRERRKRMGLPIDV